MATRLRYGAPEEVGMSGSRIKRLARLAEGWVADGSHQALVVLAARRGVIVLHEAFGRLTPEPDAPPVALDTIFPVASISKPITAATALTLVDDGLLGLNRPVQEYLPEFVGEGKEAVMVHHLLTHTAGYEDEQLCARLRELERLGELPGSTQPSHVVFDSFPYLRYPTAAAAANLARPPGKEMSYSSYGIFLIGEIVERVAGQTLASFAGERVFLPLGVKDTSYGFPVAAAERVVRRAPDAKGAHNLGQPDLPHQLNAAAGACTTAYDIAVFAQMLLNGGDYGDTRILSPASVREMTKNQISGVSAMFDGQFFPEASWGLGVDVHSDKKALRYSSLYSSAAFGHPGAGGTYFWVDPVYEIVGVYFSVVLDYYQTMAEKWNADLFVNAVTAAVED